jgi:hypothetical protein
VGGALGTPASGVATNLTGLPLTAGAGVTGTLPVANGGTGAATLGSGLPLFGAGTSAITTGTLSGNTTKLATVTGTLTSTHAAGFDASGNVVDIGAPTGGGTALTTTDGTHTVTSTSSQTFGNCLLVGTGGAGLATIDLTQSINAQTGGAYTIAPTDACKTVTVGNQTYTYPLTGTSPPALAAGFGTRLHNTGTSGNATINSTGGNFTGLGVTNASSFTLAPGEWADITSISGPLALVEKGVPSSSGTSGLSGMSAGGIPIANSANTINASFTPGTGIQTFLTTPSSANLIAALTDETGTGAAVFGTAPAIAGGTLTGTFSGTHTISGIETHTAAIDIVDQAVVMELANAGTTGTTVNKLAKLTGAPSTAVIAATTDTSGIIGIVHAGAGTTGNAQITINGQESCVFDGATTAGNYVQISATVAGDCHDAGSTYPTSGQILGRVLSTNGAGGTFTMRIYGPSIQGINTAATTATGTSGATLGLLNANKTDSGNNIHSGVNTFTGTVVGSSITPTATGAIGLGAYCGKHINYNSASAGTLTINSAEIADCAFDVTAIGSSTGLATIAASGGSFKSNTACTATPRTKEIGSTIWVKVISNAGTAPVVTVSGDCG